jgi:hypothetical protein
MLPLAVLTLVLAPASLPAQSSVSLQAGAMTSEDLNAFEVGVRFSPSRVNSVGVGFSFDVVPQAFSAGAFVALADLSLAGNVALSPQARLELRGGGSALAGIGGGGGGAIGGYHVGAGLLVGGAGPIGVRLDYTYRRLVVEGETYPLPTSRSDSF